MLKIGKWRLKSLKFLLKNGVLRHTTKSLYKMGSQCSCYNESNDSNNFDCETPSIKLSKAPSIESSTQSIISNESDLYQISQEYYDIDSELLRIDNQYPIVDTVLKAFHDHIARLMKRLTYSKELTRRKLSAAAKALFDMPQVGTGYNRADIEAKLPELIEYSTIFQGCTINGKAFGIGIAYNIDGSVYEGSWSDGLYSGYGRLVYDEDHMYQGQFTQGKFNGVGTYRKGSSRYTGSWLDGYAHGIGVEVCPGSFTYEGSFINGMKSGKGTMVFFEGGAYIGNFRENLFDGFGSRAWYNQQYSGSWRRGQMHGEGKLSFSSGAKYNGSFEENMRHGVGRLVLQNGEVISGEWKRDSLVKAEGEEERVRL